MLIQSHVLFSDEPFLCDFLMISLFVKQYSSKKLTVVHKYCAGFLDGKTLSCFTYYYVRMYFLVKPLLVLQYIVITYS